MTEEPASRPAKSSRRRFLTIGAGVAGAGVAAAVGVPLVRRATRRDPDRVTMPAAPAMRIDDVTVIDPRDGSRHPKRSILVRDGRIAAVTGLPEATGQAPAALRIVDGSGRYVVPGYNNMHVHVLQAERPRPLLATMLGAGVTGVRQMAGSPDLLRYRAEGRLPLTEYAPGLLALPGSLLTPFNGGSADDARAEVTRQLQQGADFIKVVLFDREPFLAALDQAHKEGLPTSGHLPPDVSVAEASELGYTCMEHFGTGSNVWISCSTEYSTLWGQEKSELPVPGWVLGLPFMEKLSQGPLSKRLINPAAFGDAESVALLRRALDTFDEGKAGDLAKAFVANSTWQVPTLVRLRTQWLADAPEYRDDPATALMSKDALTEYRDVLTTFTELPATIRETYRKAYDMSLRLLRLCHDAGVRMMTGTDGAGASVGQHLHLEFAEWAKAGIPPLDILRATTTTPAAYLGRSDRMGRVAPGMDADFLLLDADPLADSANLSAVSAVVRAGHFRTATDIEAFIDRTLSDRTEAMSAPVCCP
jgi:imidazolonepropionase-like amidohydrolase